MILVQKFLYSLLLGVGGTSGLVDALLLHQLSGDGVGGISDNLTLLLHYLCEFLLNLNGFFAFHGQQLLQLINVAGNLNIYLKTLRQILGNLGVGVKDGH